MSGAERLSNYPYVRVRVRCVRCRRNGDLSLARLAERFGADTSLWDVLNHLTADCVRRRRTYGKLYAPCYAQLIDLVGDKPPPDLPPGYSRWRIIEGGKADDPCEPSGGDQSAEDVRTRRSNSSS